MLRTAVDAEMLASIDKGHGKTNLVVEQYALRRYMNTNLKALDFVIEHADIIEKDLILFLDEAIINLNIDAAKIILKRIDISRFKLNNFYTLYKEERAKNMLRFGPMKVHLCSYTQKNKRCC